MAFGDGNTSTDKNPVHNYEDTGYFDVTLIVCNGGCCDSVTFVKYMHINPPIAAFMPSFDCNKPKGKEYLPISQLVLMSGTGILVMAAHLHNKALCILMQIQEHTLLHYW